MIKLKQIREGLYIREEVNTLKQNSIKRIKEIIKLPTSIFSLSFLPVENKLIRVDINGVSYKKDEHFIVDYILGNIYWLGKPFDLSIDDVIEVNYYSMFNNEENNFKNVIYPSGATENSFLSINDEIFSWGKNDLGQLGHENTIDINVPQSISGLNDVKKIRGGLAHVMALTNNGEVYAWGYNNSGQLGVGYTSEKIINKTKLDLPLIHDIDCGDHFTLALDVDGNIWTWGFNNSGQLGVSSYLNTSIPTKIENIPTMTRVYAGPNSSYSIDIDGNLWSWGNNYHYQLGTGDNKNRNKPIILNNLSYIKKVLPTNDSTLILTNDGHVWAVGNNSYGKLGLGLDKLIVPQFTKLDIEDVIDLHRSNTHSLVLTSNNKVYSWGRNDQGQLGLKTITKYENKPNLIKELFNITQIICGRNHSIALRNDGKILLFGSNTEGQLGMTESITKLTTPTINEFFKNVIRVNCGDDYTFVLEKDKGLYSFGMNDCGQLGLGHNEKSFNPELVVKI